MAKYRVLLAILAILAIEISPARCEEERTFSVATLTEADQALTVVAGRILPEDQRTQPIYKKLQLVLDRLLLGQKKAFGKTVPGVIRLIDSPIPYAGTVTVSTGSAAAPTQVVGVTLGMIDDLYSKASSSEEAETRLAGILSHELGHTIDNLDPKGLHSGPGPNAQQAREIRAHLDGISILESAGYPGEAIASALESHAAGGGGAGAFEAALNSHPTDDVSRSAVRLALTSRRYDLGKPKAIYPQFPAVNLSAHVSSLAAQSWKYDPPKNLQETLHRLMAIPGHRDRPAMWSEIEFNRLLLSMDDFISKAGSAIAPKDEELLDEFMVLYRRGINHDYNVKVGNHSVGKFPRIYSRLDPEWKVVERSFRASLGEAAKDRKIQTHAESLEKIPYYRSERLVEIARHDIVMYSDTNAFRATGVLTPNNWPKVKNEAMEALSLVMSPKTVFDNFGAEFEKRLVEALEKPKEYVPPGMIGENLANSETFNFDGPLFKQLPIEFEYRLSNLVLTKLPKAVGKDRWLELLLTGYFPMRGTGASIIFPSSRETGVDGRGTGILKDRYQLLSDPRKSELREVYRQGLREIWQNRGFYAVVDVLLKNKNVDWDIVMEGLGIPLEEGRAQLRQEVRRFTQSSEYADLLRAMSNREATPYLSSLRRPHVVTKEEKNSWLGKELGPYFSGDKNPEIAKDPELARIAREVVLPNYLNAISDYLPKAFVQELARSLDSTDQALTQSSFYKLAIEASSRIGNTEFEVRTVNNPLNQMKALLKTRRSAEEKKALLREMYLKPFQQKQGESKGASDLWRKMWRSPSLLEVDHEVKTGVISELIQQGIVKGYADFMRVVRDDPEIADAQTGKWRPIHSVYLGVIPEFKDELLGELKQAIRQAREPGAKAQVYLEFLQTVFTSPTKLPASRDLDDSPAARKMKNELSELASALNLSHEEKRQAFEILTQSGPTEGTDRFFRDHLRGEIEKDPEFKREFAKLLREKRVAASSLQVQMSRALFQDRLARLKSRPGDLRSAEELVQKLNEFSPEPSTEKDRYLEEIAWGSDLRGNDLERVIESSKSYTWKTKNPLAVNAISGISEHLAQLNKKTQDELAAYLIDPQRKELPAELSLSVERQIHRSLLEAAMEFGTPLTATGEAKVREASRQAAALLKANIEIKAMDASPMEKLPVIEYLITSGRGGKPMSISEVEKYSRRYLGYAPGSLEEKVLISFMETVPEYERSVNMAYLLSHANSEKGKITALFEVFQAVGIKIGQLSSVFKIFGEKVAEETKELKSNARPLSKAEDERLLKERLSPAEFHKIVSLDDPVGNASIKVAVGATVKADARTPGKKVVFLIERPNIHEQNETNIDLTRKFLAKLKNNGIEAPYRMLDMILNGLSAQFDDELDLTREAKRIDVAADLYEKLNTRLKKDLNGWKFQVPLPSPEFKPRKDLLAIDRVQGVGLDQLGERDAEALMQEVGRPIGKAQIISLIDYGKGNPDPHKGNFLINRESKTIFPIDRGQDQDYFSLQGWRSDERYEIAQFIRSAKNRDADAIVKYALRMREPGAPKVDGKRAVASLKQRLAKASNQDSDAIIGIMESLAESGIEMKPKYSFGALKEVLMLDGEQYMPSGELKKVMEARIAHLFLEKAPVAAKDIAHDCYRRTLVRLLEMGRK